MDCPFYLAIAVIKDNDGKVFTVHHEIDSNEMDVWDEERVKEAIKDTDSLLYHLEFISVLVISNDTYGGPKVVKCWKD